MKTDYAKLFDQPDETETYELATIEKIHLGGCTLQRFTFKPGWRWSETFKETAGTESCQIHHFGIQLEGRLHVKFDNGEELEIGPGQAFNLPPGHDAWVMGGRPVVMYDFGPNISVTEEARKAA